MNTNEAVRTKLDEIFSRGLRSGVGDDANGQVCIEQAIALVHGEGLSDAPSCVHPVVRAFAVRLNDAKWSSAEARATALRDFAFGQLGTAGDFAAVRFVSKLTELTIRRVLPIALRAAGLPAEAERCEKEGTAAAARYAASYAASYAATADAATAAVYATAAAAAAVYADAATAAVYAATAAAAAAATAAATATAAVYAATATATAAAAAAATAAATATATAAAAAADNVLRASAACAVEAIAYARQTLSCTCGSR